MIGIINYGLGNLSSVNNAFKKVSDDVEIFDDPNLIKKYSKLVLPGVGSFKAGMKLLIEKKWNDRIENFVKSGNYLLGICLGMQLLFKNGFEDGQTDGLNLIEGSVTEMKIDKKLKLDYTKLFRSINNKTSLIILANPNSPTGTLIPKDTMMKIFSKTKKLNIPLVIDEA